MAELADALVSGTSESDFMWVQVPSSAPSCLERDFKAVFSFAELAASSPKRSLREMKRGEDGAAVKIARRSKPIKRFWVPQESRG